MSIVTNAFVAYTDAPDKNLLTKVTCGLSVHTMYKANEHHIRFHNGNLNWDNLRRVKYQLVFEFYSPGMIAFDHTRQLTVHGIMPEIIYMHTVTSAYTCSKEIVPGSATLDGQYIQLINSNKVPIDKVGILSYRPVLQMFIKNYTVQYTESKVAHWPCYITLVLEEV